MNVGKILCKIGVLGSMYITQLGSSVTKYIQVKKKKKIQRHILGIHEVKGLKGLLYYERSNEKSALKKHLQLINGVCLI